MSPRTATEKFRAARDLLLELRHDHDRAHAEFRWPEFDEFNWALDWFDAVARGNDRTALHVVGGQFEEEVSYAELSERSDRLANGRRRLSATLPEGMHEQSARVVGALFHVSRRRHWCGSALLHRHAHAGVNS